MSRSTVSPQETLRRFLAVAKFKTSIKVHPEVCSELHVRKPAPDA